MRARIFHETGPLFVTETQRLPVVIGDCNCVQEALNTTANFRSKVCRPLGDFLASFNLVDSFRACHPAAREYTFRRPGVAPSRLDRAYLPASLLPSLVSVWHPATTSDHAALCLSFSGSLGGRGLPPPPTPTSYWKLNSSLLKEPDFCPAFQEQWQGVLEAKPVGMSSAS